MKPGLDIIIACPQCKMLHRQGTLMSGNTIGAKFWTDGKMEAPMLPEIPIITKCGKCNSIFWIKDAEKIGEISPFAEAMEDAEVPPEWRNSQRISKLDKTSLIEALNTEIAKSSKDEKYLRVRLWWGINDEIRKGLQNIPEKDKPVFKENLEKLISLLGDEDPQERVMKAEAYREMGVFDQVSPLLQELPEKFQRAAEKIKNLSEQNKIIVSEF